MKRLTMSENVAKNGVIYGKRRVFNKRRLLIVFSLLIWGILLLLLAGVASAAGVGTAPSGSLPWESPLNAIAYSLTGPVAKALCLIMVVVSVGVLVFGGDLAGWARSVAFMTLAAGILGGAASFLNLMNVTGALI
jgi:type IV secretion system protein VirB2